MNHTKLNLRTKQSGFIQNFIIPGIVLLGIVLAGIAMLSSGVRGNTKGIPEKASMLTGVVMAQAIALTDAIQAAEADGVLAPAEATGYVAFTAPLRANGYLKEDPKLDTDITAAYNTWFYHRGEMVVANGALNAGTASADDVLTIVLDGPLKADICTRINNRLYKTAVDTAGTPGGSVFATAIDPPTGATGSGTEGCVADGTNFKYYRTVNAN